MMIGCDEIFVFKWAILASIKGQMFRSLKQRRKAVELAVSAELACLYKHGASAKHLRIFEAMLWQYAYNLA